jgi:molecular chaperone GrpE (heat shock protein)
MNATDDFASTMQILSAEAEKALPAAGQSGEMHLVLTELRALNGRLDKMENAIAVHPDLAAQFAKIDQQLSAIHDSESVNQKLFDSLHDELIRYRDNFLHESLQKPFIRDLLTLFDDLQSIEGQAAKEQGGLLRQNVENAIHALIEILHRLEVSEIESRDLVDRTLHKVVSYEPADFPQEDGQIVLRLRRGFLWRDRVLRPEEVVARRFE